MALDIFSHWLQMYSSLLVGAASHKTMPDEAGLVRAYYSTPGALFLACLTHEGALVAALVALGVAAGAEPPFPLGLDAGGAPLFARLHQICAPGLAFKTLVSLLQLAAAARRVVAHDEAQRALARGRAASEPEAASARDLAEIAAGARAGAAPGSVKRRRAASPARG